MSNVILVKKICMFRNCETIEYASKLWFN